jgi:transposase
VGGLLAQASVSADAAGYRRLLDFARARVPGRRCWAVEGAGSYGAGLAAFLQARGERVVEVGRPKRSPRRSGAKSDALDAVRAAREALAHDHPLAPRRRGDREALRVLLATRHSACTAKVSATNQLKALIVGAPEALRAELERLVAAVAPWLLELPGVGPVSAAQVLVSWSHAGRLRSEAAFAALAGANPIPASPGQVIRCRLNRSGDRQLNRALHTIVLARLRDDPETRAYAVRRRGEDKSVRDIRRCLKRAVARQMFKLLERCDRSTVELLGIA